MSTIFKGFDLNAQQFGASSLSMGTPASNYLQGLSKQFEMQYSPEYIQSLNQLQYTNPQLYQVIQTNNTVSNLKASMQNTVDSTKDLSAFYNEQGGLKLDTKNEPDGSNSKIEPNGQDAEIKSFDLFNNSGFPGINSMIRSGFDSIATAAGSQKEDTQDKIYDTASDFVSQFGVVGKVAAGAIDFWNFTDKVGGRKIKSIDGTTGSSSYANNSREAKNFRMTQGSAANKYQKLVDSSLKQTAMARNVVNLNRQAVEARQATDNTNLSFLNKKAGGVSGPLLTAKNGGILKEIKSVISKHNRKLILDENFFKEKPQENSDIKMFKDGGAVIPSGALHKNKHHLESIDPNLKQNITTKGIPVITIEEGGEIKQHAEIEKEEVILSLSLTKQIEQLWKEGTDEAAIEAGKLLTEALLRDTEDNVGLIEKIENESKG